MHVLTRYQPDCIHVSHQQHLFRNNASVALVSVVALVGVVGRATVWLDHYDFVGYRHIPSSEKELTVQYFPSMSNGEFGRPFLIHMF
jgi:hypothetical protein